MKRHLFAAAAIAAAPLAIPAQVAPLVTEAEITAFTGETDFRPAGLTVNSAGEIFVFDRTSFQILKVTPGSPNVIEVLVPDSDIRDAFEAVNGTTAMSFFNPRQLAVAADGDIVVAGFASGTANAADSIATVSNNVASPTINVVYTPVDDAVSVLDGTGALTVIGNTAYISTDTNNGVTNSLWAVDTNSGNTVPTELVAQADLDTFYGGAVTGTDLGLNAIGTDGTDVLATVSATATAPDDVIRITPAGVVSSEVTVANILSGVQALDGTATDVGFGALTVDGAGDVWLSNSFGDGAFEFGLLELSAISGGNANVSGFDGQELATGVGNTNPTTEVANDSLAYDAANDRIVFAFDFGDADGIGVITSPTSVGGWDLY